jgi:hypothetical protein
MKRKPHGLMGARLREARHTSQSVPMEQFDEAQTVRGGLKVGDFWRFENPFSSR